MLARFRMSLLALLVAGPLGAQEMTLADIHNDLSALSLQLETLSEQLQSSGNSGLSPQEAANAMVMIGTIEADLRATVGRVEALEIRIRQISEDAARRIGDLNFRLTELEGGDVSLLTDPQPLGVTVEAESEALTGERADFRAAKQALENGDAAGAATMFSAFVAAYPDGPLTSEARYLQGEALSEAGDIQNAARSYLKSFSGAPDGPFAPRSLFGLALSLNRLGQNEQACLTLSEIQVRYPQAEAELAQNVVEQQGILGCP